jgi:hypothetical protein
MYVRRALFYWQFIAVVVLPLWVLIARGIFGSSVGWDFVFFLVVCPILAIAMGAVSGLTYARKSVRSSRTISWLDVGILAVWHAAIIAYGFVDSPLLATVIVLGAIVGFWAAVWQLFTETSRRVRGVIAGFEHTATSGASQPNPESPRVIILEPGKTRDRA